MSVTSETCDVFLSFSVHDSSIAAVVRKAFAEAGLHVFAAGSLKSGEDWGKRMQEALIESQALVIVLRSAELPPSMLVELGAAMAWRKLIFVLLDGISRAQAPPFLREFHIHPIAKLSEVVNAILQSAKPLTAEEQEILVDLYASMAIPVDRLLTESLSLAELADQFNRRLGTHRSAERLARDLLTLRKRSALPRISERSSHGSRG